MTPAPDQPIVSVRGGTPLRGVVSTPGDKSISHRALLVGALADGASSVRGLSDGDDVRRTLGAIEALGAAVEEAADGSLRIEGGRDRLHTAEAPIDCGNSGTGLRLLAGVVAGLRGRSVLAGDGSLSRRPMDRIAEPLRLMGAGVDGVGAMCTPPLTVEGGALRGIDWTPPVASAQIKSCVLLAGLAADGETVVREPVRTRAHTEELLLQAGADLEVDEADGVHVVRLRASRLKPIDVDVPGDPSQAAFWLTAACLVPGSEVRVEHLYLGPARLGYLEVLRRMGADVSVEPADTDRPGGAGAVVARFAGPLRATEVRASEVPSLDEIPILTVAAAAASGTTWLRSMGELRVKESDRFAAVTDLARALGASVETSGDDVGITGVGPRGTLTHGRIDSHDDHRVAMAGAVGALAAGPGATQITGFGSVATSYPGFLSDLARLQDAPGEAATGAPTRPSARAGPLVAIDGPAGSGKSTVSRRVAERLGLHRLDTGAMYRAVTWAVIDRGVDPTDGPTVAAIARDARIEMEDPTTCIDGVDVTEAIRGPEVNRAVSVVAAIPAVRRQLVARQRRWAEEHDGGVVEGRDIGTVVFPDATLKVYLTASPDERAKRRLDEQPADVARRDRLDSTRAASPLVRARDARVLDTTGRTVDEVVEEVLGLL